LKSSETSDLAADQILSEVSKIALPLSSASSHQTRDYDDGEDDDDDDNNNNNNLFFFSSLDCLILNLKAPGLFETSGIFTKQHSVTSQTT
jgi:hypothetical protein